MRNPANDATFDGLSGQFRLAPVRDRNTDRRRRHAGQRHDCANLLRREFRRHPRTRRIGQTNAQRRHRRCIIPALAPYSYRLRPDVQPTGSLPNPDIIRRQQDYPRPHRQLLRRRMRANQSFELCTFIGTHSDRRRCHQGHGELTANIKPKRRRFCPKPAQPAPQNTPYSQIRSISYHQCGKSDSISQTGVVISGGVY